MILNPDQLTELTNRTRRSAQRRVLLSLGIPYRQRPDGSLVVFLHDTEAQLVNGPELGQQKAQR